MAAIFQNGRYFDSRTYYFAYLRVYLTDLHDVKFYLYVLKQTEANSFS